MFVTTRNLRSALVTLCALSTLGLAACADDGAVDDNVSQGWRATSMAIAQQQPEWGGSVDVDGNLSLDVGCTDGGRARIEGTYSSGDAYSVTIDFDGCTADGVVISGELALHAEVAVTATRTEVSIDYGGTLHWSGAAQGSCAIDMSASISTMVSGSGADTEVDVDAEFHGEVCGYDADAVVSASAG